MRVCPRGRVDKLPDFYAITEFELQSLYYIHYVNNGFCERVITSTAESKRVFFLNHKLHTKNED